jgi:hypothetical protein
METLGYKLLTALARRVPFFGCPNYTLLGATTVISCGVLPRKSRVNMCGVKNLRGVANLCRYREE